MGTGKQKKGRLHDIINFKLKSKEIKNTFIPFFNSFFFVFFMYFLVQMLLNKILFFQFSFFVCLFMNNSFIPKHLSQHHYFCNNMLFQILTVIITTVTF